MWWQGQKRFCGDDGGIMPNLQKSIRFFKSPRRILFSVGFCFALAFFTLFILGSRGIFLNNRIVIGTFLLLAVLSFGGIVAQMIFQSICHAIIRILAASLIAAVFLGAGITGSIVIWKNSRIMSNTFSSPDGQQQIIITKRRAFDNTFEYEAFPRVNRWFYQATYGKRNSFFSDAAENFEIIVTWPENGKAEVTFVRENGEFLVLSV